MKDGVHIQYLYSDTAFNYWKSELANHVLANKFKPIDKERKEEQKNLLERIIKIKL